MLDVSKVRNKQKERPWYKPALELIKKIKNGVSLDVGCGMGEFAILLKKRGFNVYCTDGSKRYVKNAENLGFNAKQTDFNNTLPFKDGFFDLVSCLEVIEHIENAENLIDEMRRVLKKKGYLLISTPNSAFLGSRIRALLGLPIADEGYHFRFFTYNSLIKLLKKNKFKIVSDNSISFLPFYLLTKKNPKAIKIKAWRNLLASKCIILAKEGK